MLIPRSLFGRLVLVMTAGLLAAQLISVTLHLIERQRTAARSASEEIAERVAAIYRVLDSQAGSERAQLARLLTSTDLAAAIEPAGQVWSGASKESAAFMAILRQALRPGVLVEARSTPQLGVLALDLRLELTDGNWLHMRGAAAPYMFAWPTHLFVNLAVMLLSLSCLSWFAVRAVTRPLGALAYAASGLGEDINRAPLAETGPTEVAAAAREFNLMQARLRASIDERARFLAAVSHDLKTPITRLRLRAEMLENAPVREKFAADLKEMDDLVNSALGFLRGESVDEPLRQVNVSALVESVVDDFVDSGADLVIESGSDIRLDARPHGLRRCLSNLIDNALKYGGDEVSLAIEATPECVDILICDRGPGVPDGEIEKVFEPFYRVESSRSRETGGSGLGLAIARQIARAQGGEVMLANRKEGGLEVRLRLPRRECAKLAA
ncbi:MAG: ATP-binding protein [Telluria sp.]|nr:ATP-binding protein [Telluria sp.]